MATRTVREIDHTRTRDNERRRRYDVTYQVETDDPFDDAGGIALAVDLTYPMGSAFTWNGSLRDSGAWRTAEGEEELKQGKTEEGTNKLWIARRFYDSAGTPGHCSTSDFTTPLDIPWTLDTGGFDFERLAVLDKDGDPIVNAAGEPFFPATTTEDARCLFTFRKNLPTRNLFQIATYQRGVVNSDTMWGVFPPRTLRVKEYTTTQAFLGTCQPYYPTMIQLEVNVNKWNDFRVERGFRQKLANGNLEEMRDDKQELLSEPHALDANGLKLPAGQAPVIKETEIIPELPFAALPLPATIQ